MCGICGIWNPAGVDADLLTRMNDTLTHRGPDDAGVEPLGETGLAARRLSIIDVEHGHQPVANEDGSAWIAFNGEIYNYRELRQGLLRRGHRFRTESDTEVVLHLYEEQGLEVVQQLRGMFAFAIWDLRKRRLMLARDHFGQKPLFYAQDGGRFLFGSEIKAILEAMPQTPEPDLGSLDDYLTLRFVPSPSTMFTGIRKLPPGHHLTLDVAEEVPQLDVQRYWQLSYDPKQKLSDDDAIDQVREQLIETVKYHLVSDVPVGAFLSGGMDSSLLVAMMSEITGEPVRTFSIGVKEEDFNELEFAREVAQHCGAQATEEVVWPDLVRLLPRIVRHIEEPSDPIAACMHHSSALAARHLKVVLTGDGGDEMFAGFDRYYGYRWVGLYAALPEPLRRGLLGPLLQLLPDSSGYKNTTQKARWLHDLSFHRGGRRYAEATAFFRFGAGEKQGLYGPSAAERLVGRDATRCIVAAFEEAQAEDDLDRMLYTDVVTRMTEHSLMLTDRMAMSQGLEGRSPFLDPRLAESVATLPVNLKIRGKQLKYVMRRVAEPYLPESILRRPKQGFMFPLAYWMKGPLLPVLQELVHNSHVVESGIFRREMLERLLQEHLAGRADHHVRLWMILNVEIWYRMYLNGESEEQLAAGLEARVAS